MCEWWTNPNAAPDLTYAGGRVASGRVRLDVTRVYWHLCHRGAVVRWDGKVSQRQECAGLHSGAQVALLNLAVQLQFRGASIRLGIIWKRNGDNQNKRQRHRPRQEISKKSRGDEKQQKSMFIERERERD